MRKIKNPAKHEGNPRVLYHGTTEEYVVRELTDHHSYSSLGFDAFGRPVGVFLEENIGHACCYAMRRAEEFKCNPAMLIVDTTKLKCKIKQESRGSVWIAEELNQECFYIAGNWEIKLDEDGKINFFTENFIREITDLVLKNTKTLMRQLNSEFINEYFNNYKN